MNTEVKDKISSGEISIGEKIVPTTICSSAIDKEGTLVEQKKLIHSRKFNLRTIREQFLEEHVKAGVMRQFSDEEYKNLSKEEIRERYHRISEPIPAMNKLEKLKVLERTRHLKLWHDHSDLLSHTYISFMISVLYDTTLYLTNEEYKAKFPDKKPKDVSSIVEKPKLYILGRSKSSDKEQLTYIKERLTDLEGIDIPLYYNEVPTYDILRFFSGDGPARQFEAGQQRGGHYSCICGIRADEQKNLPCSYQKSLRSLEERRQTFVNGTPGTISITIILTHLKI